MKVTVEVLKEKINQVREDIRETSVSNIKNDAFGGETEQSLVEELFHHVDNISDLENHIWETVSDFCNKNISVEDVFACRHSRLMSDFISEIISECDNTLDSDSVSSIDKVLESASFRYMLMVGSNLEKELLQVYLLDNVFVELINFENDLELDASEYGEYDDEESLLEAFIDELISNISGSEKVIHIEDNAKEALNDFFQLEV